MYKKRTREDFISISKDLGDEAPDEEVLDILMDLEDMKEAAWMKGYTAGVMAASEGKTKRHGQPKIVDDYTK